MVVADPKRPRQFNEEFKRQVVQLYEAGKPVEGLQSEYDIGHSMLHRWITGIREHGSISVADARTPEQNELIALRKENRQLRMEVDVLKQEALIFARKQG
ncbi:MAG: transposase [Bifidobacterium sp.]|jgi:transposase|nr:transposase [Bifidobacterium sp.]